MAEFFPFLPLGRKNHADVKLAALALCTFLPFPMASRGRADAPSFSSQGLIDNAEVRSEGGGGEPLHVLPLQPWASLPLCCYALARLRCALLENDRTLAGHVKLPRQML